MFRPALCEGSNTSALPFSAANLGKVDMNQTADIEVLCSFGVQREVKCIMMHSKSCTKTISKYYGYLSIII